MVSQEPTDYFQLMPKIICTAKLSLPNQALPRGLTMLLHLTKLHTRQLNNVFLDLIPFCDSQNPIFQLPAYFLAALPATSSQWVPHDSSSSSPLAFL